MAFQSLFTRKQWVKPIHLASKYAQKSTLLPAIFILWFVTLSTVGLRRHRGRFDHGLRRQLHLSDPGSPAPKVVRTASHAFSILNVMIATSSTFLGAATSACSSKYDDIDRSAPPCSWRQESCRNARQELFGGSYATTFQSSEPCDLRADQRGGFITKAAAVVTIQPSLRPHEAGRSVSVYNLGSTGSSAGRGTSLTRHPRSLSTVSLWT